MLVGLCISYKRSLAAALSTPYWAALRLPSAVAWKTPWVLGRSPTSAGPNAAFLYAPPALALRTRPSSLIARVAASLSFLHSAPALAFPTHAASLPPDFLDTLLRLRNSIDPSFGPLGTWVSSENTLVLPLQPEDPSHRRQKWWSKALYARLAESVFATATLRDRTRLRL